MCVNCEKKMLNIYRQGKTFTDQFYVDEDYNVPDTKADIREIIEGDAVMEEIDLKLVENYIRITGRLAFQVLYVADNSDNTLSSLEGKIPFEEMYYVVGKRKSMSHGIELTSRLGSQHHKSPLYRKAI